jgi:uncharacterized protein (TIGR02996 family)
MTFFGGALGFRRRRHVPPAKQGPILVTVRITELERAFLDPQRPHHLRAQRIGRGARTGREAWERLAAEGLVPAGERWFRVTARELAKSGHREEELRRICISSISGGARSLVLPHPGSAEAAVAFAAVEGLAEAEAQAREFLRRLEPFHFLLPAPPKRGARTPVWRVIGSPEAPPREMEIEGAFELAGLASQFANVSLPVRTDAFATVAMCAMAGELWATAERPLPAQILRAGTPQAMVRTRLGQHADPFEPLLEIWRLGFGIRRLTRETMLLYLPHRAPPARARRPSAIAEEALRLAVLRQEAVPALELLERGVDPDAADASGRTALHFAAWTGRTQTAVLSALLDAGADPDRQDDDGLTPLALAVDRDLLRVANTFFELGLDPQHRIGGGRTLLHVAARAGSTRMIELLLDRGLEVDSRCARGRTPLHEAAMARASYANEAADALLGHGADPNARDRFGWTALHYAVLNPYAVRLAELAIERGARSLPDRGGRVPTDLREPEHLPREFVRAVRGVATPLDPLPPAPRNEALEEAIRDAPSGGDAWSVYADWLASVGDPHAELIHLGLAAERAPGDERAQLFRSLRSAIEDRRFEVLGELQRIEPTLAAAEILRRPNRFTVRAEEDGSEYGFEHGFLVHLDHHGSHDALRTILTSDLSRFLRHLSVRGQPAVRELLETIGSKSLRSLELNSYPTTLAGGLAVALPRVKRLRLVGSLPRAIVWPGLEELAFMGWGWHVDEPVRLDTFLPDVRRLHLSGCDDRDRTRLLALAYATLPKLTSLAWHGPGSTFIEITRAGWFPQLERLDVMQAGPETIARVEKIAPERPNLRRLCIHAPQLATADKRALAARLSVFVRKVRVS